MATPYDEEFGTGGQVEFSRRMAEALLKRRKGIQEHMLTAPYGWMSTIPDMVDDVGGLRYRNIAGVQEKALSDRRTNPSHDPEISPTLGSKILGGLFGTNKTPKTPSTPKTPLASYAPGEFDSTSPAGPKSSIVEGGAPKARKVSSMEEYLPTLINIESSGNPGLVNKYGYKGLGQLNDADIKKYGMSLDPKAPNHWANRDLQIKAITAKAEGNRAELSKYIGREPTWGETYLAHQQGTGGASVHINNPNGSAVANLLKTKEGRDRGVDWAIRAIRDNIPDGHPLKNIPIRQVKSGDFSKIYTQKFDAQADVTTPFTTEEKPEVQLSEATPEDKISGISPVPRPSSGIPVRPVQTQSIPNEPPLTPPSGTVDPSSNAPITPSRPIDGLRGGINPFAPKMDPKPPPNPLEEGAAGKALEEIRARGVGEDKAEQEFYARDGLRPPTGEVGPKGDLGGPNMRLGAPGFEKGEPRGDPKGVELAQSFNSPTAKPAGEGGRIINIPGYRGPAPNAPYLETDDEIRAQMNSMTSLDKGQEVFQKWKEKAEPYHVEVPNGFLEVTPRKGGGADYKFMHGPSKDQIGDVGLSRTFDKEGNTSYPMKLPSGSPAGKKSGEGAPPQINSYEDWVKYKQRLEQEGSANAELMKGKTDTVQEAIKAGGPAAHEQIQTINAMDSISKTAGNDISRGPTAKYMTLARQFVENFLPGTTKGASDEEVLSKLNSILASESTRAISQNRGSNFELQTFMRANPDLMQTKHGMEMLLDIMRQGTKQKIEIGEIANMLKGEDVEKFNRVIKEYYLNNPIIIKRPSIGKDNKVTYEEISTVRIEKPEDVRRLVPSGKKFLTPDGRVGTAP